MCTMEDGNIYTELDIEENISDMSSHTFEGVVDMNTDDNNIYLFHGSNNENMTFRKLGKISKEDREMDLKENELNIFIKLVCK